MQLQDEMNFEGITVQTLNETLFNDTQIQLDVLRLDKIHPVVSGNKWFKLKYYLQQAIENNYRKIATFGGAYSNHILAAAYACNKQKISCIGFIRGEEPEQYSQTLLDAQLLNMQFEFVSRATYQNKEAIMQANAGMFFIPEGGYGIEGARGAADIINIIPNSSSYNYIVCAAGTGATIAGIANASEVNQYCIAVSVMKNNFSLNNELLCLVKDEAKNRVMLLNDYHFGGYAKYNLQLIEFMNKIWRNHQLPLDFVYTAKALFAVYDLAEKKYFLPNSKILFVHSGGLQGNRSLPAGLLQY